MKDNDGPSVVLLVVANLILILGVFFACVPAILLEFNGMPPLWDVLFSTVICWAASWFFIGLGNTGIHDELQKREEES